VPIEPHARSVAAHEHSEAVVLDFVQPVRWRGRYNPHATRLFSTARSEISLQSVIKVRNC
jgi:hypothetical protein